MAERYANCTVSYEMHSDRRFDLLAELGGWTRNDACWRMVQLWARCTAMQTDCPPSDEVRIHLGLRGEQLLADAALAERRSDGTIRVLGGGLTGGDTDRFSWYAPVARRGAAGGAARADRARRGHRGQFVAGASEHQQATSNSTSETSKPPASYPQPPASGFRIPDQRSESLSEHAIPPTPVPSTTPAQSFADRDLAKARAVGSLAEATWQRLSELRMRHASKLRLEGVLPLVVITPGTEVDGFRELRARIRAEGESAHQACDHVLAVLDEQALDTKSIEWLSEKAFLERPWRKARETTLKPKRRPAVAAPERVVEDRGGPIGLAEIAAMQASVGVAKEPA